MTCGDARPLRARYHALQRQAAEAGLWCDLSLTPRELFLRLAAHRSALERQARERCLLAHLMALALHAPDRLPPLPAPAPAPAMTADAIKQRLLAWRGKDDPA